MKKKTTTTKPSTVMLPEDDDGDEDDADEHDSQHQHRCAARPKIEKKKLTNQSGFRLPLLLLLHRLFHREASSSSFYSSFHFFRFVFNRLKTNRFFLSYSSSINKTYESNRVSVLDEHLIGTVEQSAHGLATHFGSSFAILSNQSEL